MSKVIIVGGGIIGLCTAYYARKAGHEVLVADRNPQDHGSCSFGNAGMVVPSHFIPLAAPGMVALGLKWMWNPESPFYIKPRLNLELLRWGWRFYRAATAAKVARAAPVLRDLHLASRTCFEELNALPGVDFGLVKKGLLMLCKTAHALEEESAGARKAVELGIPAEVLDASGTAALDPGVRMDVLGSVYYPMDCHLSPAVFVARLREELTRIGAEIRYGTEITNWHVDGGQVRGAVTKSGALEGDEFVLCGGSWSDETAKGLQLSLPLQAGKGYSVTIPNPRRLPTICSILTEARVAVTPMAGALRFAGTMEISGLNEEINPVRVRGIIKSGLAYFPDFQADDFSGLQPWRGLRPCSPDGLPYVGRVGRYRNFSVATGHSMMGLSLGPVTGKLMSQILSNTEPSIKIDLLNPDRYA